MTLHLAAAQDFPAYAQLARQARLRAWRTTYPQLDQERVDARPRALALDAAHEPGDPRAGRGLRRRAAGPEHADPRRPHAGAARPAPAGRPLARHDPQLAPRARPAPAARRPTTPARSSSPATSRRSARPPSATSAAWAGVAQRDFPWHRLQTVSYRDEKGIELLDLAGRPLPPADTKLPPRFLAHWDQPLLAYADRDRIIPPEVQPLKLTLSGALHRHLRRPRRGQLDHGRPEA